MWKAIYIDARLMSTTVSALSAILFSVLTNGTRACHTHIVQSIAMQVRMYLSCQRKKHW